MKKILTTLLSIVSMANASTIIWNAEEANVYDFYDTANWDFSESCQFTKYNKGQI